MTLEMYSAVCEPYTFPAAGNLDFCAVLLIINYLFMVINDL